MSCGSTSRTLMSIYLSLVINSVLLCCCYLLYTLDWMRHTTTCGQSGIVISYVTASSSLFYGIVSVVTTAIFCLHLVNSERNPRSFCVAAIAWFIVRLPAIYNRISSNHVYQPIHEVQHILPQRWHRAGRCCVYGCCVWLQSD
ncbi:hypothetical protein GCK32_008179 [Trichostrongylus colubriformis]|uniref:Uncharacterized protein n=1 Tax=Trichostrongylus colubriformis TaxID=6319 RepID=A0AAN8EU29_TRICO